MLPAILLIYLFVPGATHLTAHAVQLLGHGHSSDADHHAVHHEPGGEHDCSGLFHNCVCHSSPLVTVRDRSTPLSGPTHRGVRHRAHQDGYVTSGFPDSLFRPPIT